MDVDGRVLAHVDLGALGVADRWADIAVAAMSTTRNCGPGWERTLIDTRTASPPTASVSRTTETSGTRRDRAAG
nr:hypothetical protein [Microbacterium lacticum]